MSVMELEAVMQPTVLTNSLQGWGHTKKSQVETQSAFFGTRAHVRVHQHVSCSVSVFAMYFNEWMGRIACVGAVLAGGGGGGGVDVGAYSSCYRNIPGIDLWLTVLHLHLSGVSVSSVLGRDALVLITVEQRRWGDSICIGFRGGFCAEMMEEEIYSGPWRQQISPQGQLYSKGDTLDSK